MEEIEKINIQSEKEIMDYISRLETIISEYIGFPVHFPIEKSEKSGEINLSANVKYKINIPGLLEEITTDVLSKLSDVMERSINKSEILDYDLFYTLSSEVSLSLIFENYISNNIVEKIKKTDFINDLREISSRTYESEPIDLGVVYCPNDTALKDLTNLKQIDIIKITKPLNLKEFFLNEKPLLKIIDKKSLVVAINQDFKVFAILRKKEGEKSLSTIFEGLFHKYDTNHITKKVISSFLQPLEERQSLSEAEESIHNNIMGLIKSNIAFFDNNNRNEKVPKFIYIDVQNKKINFLTSNKFEISYYNGDWKLRHYNLLFASIFQTVSTVFFPYFFAMENTEFENFIKVLSSNVSKLLQCVKKLSISNCSSIFVILENSDINDTLSTKEVKKILQKPILKQSDTSKNYIKTIKRGAHHLNIKDIDSYLLELISKVDGAVILDTNLNILSFGEVIHVAKSKDYSDTYGTGTRACRAASEFGVSIKVSEDGDISLFRYEEKILTL